MGNEMESSFSDLEQKIISYLHTYGNTKETDLFAYGVQRLGISEEGMIKLVDEMLLYGKLERVVHKELEPKVGYLKPGQSLLFELEMQTMSNAISQGKVTEQQIEKAKEILEDARAASKERIKRKRALATARSIKNKSS
jgi:hypothetical protein